MQTEQQNALEVGRMMIKDDSLLIGEELAKGNFVVVEIGTSYCPFTDAINGSRQFVLATFQTLVDADGYLKHYMLNDNLDPDHDYLVLKPYTELEVVGINQISNEIPF